MSQRRIPIKYLSERQKRRVKQQIANGLQRSLDECCISSSPSSSNSNNNQNIPRSGDFSSQQNISDNTPSNYLSSTDN